MAASTVWHSPASAPATPRKRKDKTRAGPAPLRTRCPAASYCPAAAVPIAPKIPAPITAPIPSMTRSPAPSARFSAYGLSPSTSNSAIGLRRNSCLDKQRRQDERHRAQQLDEHVQGRARGGFERIAHRVAHDARLVRRAALAPALPRLDEFLGVVPRAAAVVQHSGDQDPADRAHHEERRHRLGADVEQA